MEAKPEQLLAELEREKRKNNLIRLLAGELGKASNLGEKLANILEVLDIHLRLQHTMLLLPDADGRCLRVFASRGFPEERLGTEIRIGDGIIGVVAERKKKFRINNLRRQSQYVRQSVVTDGNGLPTRALPGLPGAESQVAFPLLADATLVAVLSAESTDVNFFSREDEDFLQTMSQLLALSIQNARIIDQLEEKVKERTAELEIRRQELERANASKDRLFAIIGHDLRSPAASLQNVAELIQYYTEKGATDQVTELSRRIVGAARNINHLLDNLLNWSITQTGDLVLQPETLSLQNTINEVFAIYQEDASSKDIVLMMEARPDLFVYTDRNALLTILRNLLGNAVKFTRAGGRVAICFQEREARAEIVLTDDGVGISSERLPTLFGLRETRSTRGTFKEKGTGLGLVLVRELVRRSDGQIWIESQVECGTTVRLQLPLAR